MASQLDSIAALPDQKAKLDRYRDVLNAMVATGSVADLQAFIEHVLSDTVPLVVSRQLLTAFAHSIAQLPPEPQKEVAENMLARVAPRLVSFEEQVAGVREALAALHERQEDWTAAAQTLAGIDLDSGVRLVEPEYKLAKYVKISMLYLEDDDAVNAETYIKKASTLIASCKDDGLELQFRSCYVRILDSKRKFVEAAQRYYELSQMQNQQVSEDDLEAALAAAVVCCILAKAGPQRSRILANLYKDERTAGLQRLFPFMEKVYLERILRPDEVAAFGKELKPHQMASLPDGTTVLEAAVIEHNLAAAARLYDNIYLGELGTLLGVDAGKAEEIASKMVMESRLKGTIDQVDGLIAFDREGERLLQWDDQIQGVCQSLNNILDGAAARGVTPMTA
jgi:COP9 signalosome complex subunit 4